VLTNKTSVAGGRLSSFDPPPSKSVSAPPPREVVSVRSKPNGNPPPPATVYSREESRQADEVEKLRQVADKLKLGFKKKKVSL
jgi:hypothetical protein